MEKAAENTYKVTNIPPSQAQVTEELTRSVYRVLLSLRKSGKK